MRTQANFQKLQDFSENSRFCHLELYAVKKPSYGFPTSGQTSFLKTTLMLAVPAWNFDRGDSVVTQIVLGSACPDQDQAVPSVGFGKNLSLNDVGGTFGGLLGEAGP